MAHTTDDLIERGLYWAKQFPERGMPADITEQDATVTERVETRNALDYDGVFSSQTRTWTVVIRDRWAVDLDHDGMPCDPPRRIRYR